MEDLNTLANEDRLTLVSALGNSVRDRYRTACTPGGKLTFNASQPECAGAAPDMCTLNFRCKAPELKPVHEGLCFYITAATLDAARSRVYLPVALIVEGQTCIEDLDWMPLLLETDQPGNIFNHARVPIDGESFRNGAAPFMHFEQNFLPELTRMHPADEVMATRQHLLWRAALS